MLRMNHGLYLHILLLSSAALARVYSRRKSRHTFEPYGRPFVIKKPPGLIRIRHRLLGEKRLARECGTDQTPPKTRSAACRMKSALK